MLFADDCSECKYNCHKDCFVIQKVSALYNAGYRKAEEVRKETAKEIYRKLYLNSYQTDKMFYPSFEVWKNVLKEYGIELE